MATPVKQVRSEESLTAQELAARAPARSLAQQAFSRAAGSPLIEGNRVRLLKNAADNYPAWLEAIAAAKHHVHFENYIIHDDEVGSTFAQALKTKARGGVHVRLVYDWFGSFNTASRSYWNSLREAGVEVRSYNAPPWASLFGGLSRDHRKCLSVDGEVAFVSGLCVGKMWVGNPTKKLEPWRDTGLEIRGPAVTPIEAGFAELWASLGSAIPDAEQSSHAEGASERGNVGLRVVTTSPMTSGLLRVNELVAALAQHRLWLTDAYYTGKASYLQALRAAVKDGVDVRLLVPGTSDLFLLKPFTGAGYRPLLEAGVRIFEWNGTMLHAKTAVADSRWARVGSSNLNFASWFGNYELDVLVEDQAFAESMEKMYLEDLDNSTEIVLDARQKLRLPKQPKARLRLGASGGGVAVARIGNTLGAAFTGSRSVQTHEGRTATLSGLGLLALAILFTFFPRLIAVPLSLAMGWSAVTLLFRGIRRQLSDPL